MEVITLTEPAYKTMMEHITRTAQNSDRLVERIIKLELGKDEVMTIEEVADYLKVEYSWVYLRRNRIGYFKEGRVVRFKKSQVDSYFEKHFIKSK